MTKQTQGQQPPKAKVTRERDVNTYALLWIASGKVLEAGVREATGSSWQFLSSIVLTAFSLEAYLNHVGPTILSSWDGLERLRPEAKLDLVCEILKVQPGGKGVRPLQTVTKLFKFRNTVAHGRTHRIELDAELVDAHKVDDHFRQRLLTDWERLIRTDDFAQNARTDAEEIMKLIHAAAPEPKERLFSSGFETGSATVV